MPAFTKKQLFLFIVMVVFFLLIASEFVYLYMKRPPILVVTDNSFALVHGQKRVQNRTAALSRTFFRQVKPVLVNENSNHDQISVALESVSEKPWVVVVPWRYLNGGRFYKEKNPDIPVLVVGGPIGHIEEILSFARADLITDLYRAGASAARLAGGKKVVFFSDVFSASGANSAGISREEYEEAFSSGFKTVAKDEEEPVFLANNLTYSDYSEVGCVVVSGPASQFLEKNRDIPIILFSWIEPALTPFDVKVLFDDSPWTFIQKAIKSYPGKGGELLIPSETIVFRGKIAHLSDFLKVKSLLKGKLK